MLVISSPSGAGKSTISRMLLADEPNLSLSISATTRTMRQGEQEGREYYFVSPDRFTTMVQHQEFFEHATVFDHQYGTPKKPVLDLLAEGKDVLFDIDWQGAASLTTAEPAKLVKIFILPPSLPELERRLHSRNADSTEVIARRMAQAKNEISHYRDYDYVLINQDVATCVAEVRTILHAERLKRVRCGGLDELVQEMV
jgi:guanylate kinase